MELTKHRQNPGNFLRFLSSLRPFRRRLAGSLILGIFQYNIPVVFPWILKDVIDRLFAGKPSGVGLTFDQLMSGAVLLFLLLAVITYFRTSVTDRLAQDMTFRLRSILFEHLEKLPVEFFQRFQTGAISSRLVTDVNMAQDVINVAGANFLMDITTLTTITVIIFSLNWRLALVAYCSLPLYLAMQTLVGRRMRDNARESRKRMEVIEGDLHETISGISDVKSFTFEKRSMERFYERYRSYLEAVYRNIRTQGLSVAVTTALTRIPSVLVIWVGGHMVLGHTLTIGSLMAFFAYLEMIYNPLTRLSEINIQIANARAAVDRLFQLLDEKPEPRANAPAKLSVRGGEVTFEDVVFGYRSDQPVLKGVRLEIPPGGSVAVVGESGSGKSTLIKLLIRFYEPWQGRVCIDGQDVCCVDLASLRSQIAVVQQDLTLFSGSVEENIKVGRPKATRREVMEAVEFANARCFIEELPEGFDTRIGERGMALSGGQKQRIAIARAYLKNAPILVLDESTSNLDNLSENIIYQALKKLIEKRTTIIIAHRMSTIMLADRAVVFSQGELVQEGSHEELLKQAEGQYSRLYGGGLTKEVIDEAAAGLGVAT